MPRSRRWPRSMPGIATGCWRSGSSSTPPASGWRSSTWASTTSSTPWPGLSTRWRPWPSLITPRPALSVPDALHDDLGELVGVVVGGDPLVHHVGQDEVHLAPDRRLAVEDDLRLTPGRGVGVVRVDDREVEDVAADVVLEHAHEVGDPEVAGLPVLRGDVADEDLERRAGAERIDHAADQQVGQDAGVEGPRADRDQVGIEDGERRLGVDLGRVGAQEDAGDGRLLEGDLR